MKAAFLTSESILEGIRDVIVERLEHTRKALERPPLSDESVHTVRKELKRARAGLRFLRDALGIRKYRQLNRAIRDTARPLTPVRDTKVLLQALDKLAKQADASSFVSTTNELRHSLQQALLRHRTQMKAEEFTAIRNRLNMVERSLRDLPDTRLDRVDVDAAILRGHKKALKAFKAVKREPSDENLHEWRKQVKYEINQLELLQPLKPKRIAATVLKAEKLSEHLGDDHDFALLHEWIVAQSEQATTCDVVTDAEALLKTLKDMRAKLQRKAYRLGKPLYAGKSKRRT